MGVIKRCCWGLCTSDSRYPERLPEGTFFLPFPKLSRIHDNMTPLERDRAVQRCEKAKRWQHLCGRSDFQRVEKIADYTYICSLHFVGGKGPRSEDDDPILCTPTVQRIRGKIGKRKVLSTSDASENDSLTRSLKIKRDDEMIGQQTLENMISGNNFDIRDLQVQHVQLLKAFAEMRAEADKLHTENEKLEDALQSDFSKLSYSFLQCDNEQLLFLTGLHAVAFDWLIPKITRIIFRVHPEVKPQDHLLIVLMKLKLGLCDDDLGYRFQIDGGIITAICQTWIPALAAVVSPLVAWPSRDTIVKTQPSVFMESASECCCIVDTRDVTLAAPNAATKTVSYLIGVTPAGAISFVSTGFFCRKKTDRRLIMESGFVDLLKPNDLILTNKTLSVQKELSAIGVTLLTQDVAKGKKSANTKAMDLPAAVWSRVETAMDWWKDFGVFQTAVPADYEEMLDDVVVICAALTNLKMSLVPRD